MNLKSLLQAFLFVLLPAGAAFAQDVKYVIHISIDGGGAGYIRNLVDGGLLPNFQRLQTEGASTFNARSDCDFTVTLPNHITQVTGRPVSGITGHNWTANEDPEPEQTLHTNKGSYIAGVFDVVHDNGLSTGMFVGKSKFSLFDTSYNAENGAADTTGEDNGRDKIDKFVYIDNDSAAMTDEFISAMQSSPLNYSFLHYDDPDCAGHGYGWGSEEYYQSLISADTQLGRIFNLLDTDVKLHGRTAIVLTADHGGNEFSHDDASDPLAYTIPFFAWGPGITQGADLYALNTSTRVDPGAEQIPYSDELQPIRNGDAANLELQLLGLESIPGSTINSIQNLAVPEPSSVIMLAAAVMIITAGNNRRCRKR
jgi:hypothetical protein